VTQRFEATARDPLARHAGRAAERTTSLLENDSMLHSVFRRMTAVRAVVAATFVAAGALLGACGDATSGSNGRVSILLTDAPGDFKSAVVTIDEIYLQGDGGRVVLRSEPWTGDLLDLANATTELVKDAEVPTGSYQQLRFVVSGGYIEVEGESGASRFFATSGYDQLPAGVQPEGTLQMPSFSSSGLKVKLPGDAMTVTDGQRVVLVDFDVSRSFGKEAGNSGRWVMSPVLEATDFAFSGNVRVSLTNPQNLILPTLNGSVVTLAGVQAVLTNTTTNVEETLAFADENNDGTWEANFRYLVPGQYKVSVRGPLGTTFTTDPIDATVTVAAGAESSQAFALTAATAP